MNAHIKPTINLLQGDCLELLKTIPDNSIDLILTDPPYYQVLKKEAWDNQWETLEEFLDWIEIVGIELKRVLKTNGAMLMFAHSRWAAYVQIRMDKHFYYLNHLVWRKTNSLPASRPRAYNFFALNTERCLFYRHPEAVSINEELKKQRDTYPRLRKYFADLKKAIGKDNKDIAIAIGTTGATHAFQLKGMQWYLPTRETYEKLLSLGRSPAFEPRAYEDLKREFDKETKREIRRLKLPPNRHFEFQPGFMEVIDCGVNSTNRKHPAQKPLPLLQGLIRSACPPGGLTLDPFAGSASTGVAAIKEGRRFIGFEKDDHYFKVAQTRLELAAAAQKG